MPEDIERLAQVMKQYDIVELVSGDLKLTRVPYHSRETEAAPTLEDTAPTFYALTGIDPSGSPAERQLAVEVAAYAAKRLEDMDLYPDG